MAREVVTSGTQDTMLLESGDSFLLEDSGLFLLESASSGSGRELAATRSVVSSRTVISTTRTVI